MNGNIMLLSACLLAGFLQQGHTLEEKLCAAGTHPKDSSAPGLIQASRNSAARGRASEGTNSSHRHEPSNIDQAMLREVQNHLRTKVAAPPPAWNTTCQAAFHVNPSIPVAAVKDLNKPGLKWFYNIPRGQQPKQVKLGFVLTIRSNFGNLNAWKNWLERGRRDGVDAKFLVFEYGMDREAANFSSILATWPDEFRSGLHPRKEANAWCRMMATYITLSAELLKDPEVSYVFTWDGSHGIPTKSLLHIQRAVAKDPRTRFCGNWNGDHVGAEGSLAIQRADLEVFLWKEHATQNQTAAIAHNIRRLKQQFPFFLSRPNACDEELGFFTPLLLRELHEKIHNPQRYQTNPGVKDSCKLYTDWARQQDSDCTKQKPWGSNVAYCDACHALKKSPLATWATAAHPATYAKVSTQAYLELWRSPFWTARKMVDGAVDDDAAAVAGMGDED
eukprot:TRINITY_DN23962_c0_g1_i1.p1 TRINITY_DN23962_c0_g1~~TRINITY_DN23962_c0_g1_i1.p1  ORF type:complete len:446 (-),score=59.84 TRINITY_DN23962_c0_g1_i1:123-1460(-)